MKQKYHRRKYDKKVNKNTRSEDKRLLDFIVGKTMMMVYMRVKNAGFRLRVCCGGKGATQEKHTSYINVELNDEIIRSA